MKKNTVMRCDPQGALYREYEFAMQTRHPLNLYQSINSPAVRRSKCFVDEAETFCN